jgi:DNA repair protein RecO
MVFEGLVIAKTPYKERDLIAKVLLRNGLLASFYVYGGQGGGKHHKPSIYEIGSMMKIQIKDQKSKGELLIATESQRIWQPQHIRHNIQAFYLICLYLEILQKFTPVYEMGVSDLESQEQEGFFSVVSNALFHLDDSLAKDQFLPEQQLMLFMIKFLFHLGIMPETDICAFCSSSLVDSPGVIFQPDQGQFACHNCAPGTNDKNFLLRVKFGFQTKFQDYSLFQGATFQESDKLIQYFCHHFNLKPVELKSYKLLFK